MFCSPASSSRATNGVVFHTSASTTGTQASVASMNQTGGCPVSPVAASNAFAMPAWPSNMNRQSSAETTVGMAHGTSTAARTRARPRNARFMARASTQPSPSSSDTVTAAKNSVWAMAPQNRGSLSAST